VRATSTADRREPAGRRIHLVTLQNPGVPVPDGDGGTVATWTDLAPSAVMAAIGPASVRDLERLAAGTVITQATHVITIPYHPQVTTAARVLFRGRSFSLVSVVNPGERNIQLVCLGVEVVG
jgi:SPP1 family predicted phage head-tail adaptor